MKGEKQLIGARGEYTVIGKLMELGLLVYTPVVDVEGIDCIIHNGKGRLIKIQIKTRTLKPSTERRFAVKDFKPDVDFFICLYYIDTDELWTIPSVIYHRMAYKNPSGHLTMMMNQVKRKELNKYYNEKGLGLFKLKAYKT